jgi:hypothetical protein
MNCYLGFAYFDGTLPLWYGNDKPFLQSLAWPGLAWLAIVPD